MVEAIRLGYVIQNSSTGGRPFGVHGITEDPSSSLAPNAPLFIHQPNHTYVGSKHGDSSTSLEMDFYKRPRGLAKYDALTGPLTETDVPGSQ